MQIASNLILKLQMTDAISFFEKSYCAYDAGINDSKDKNILQKNIEKIIFDVVSLRFHGIMLYCKNHTLSFSLNATLSSS